MTVSGKEQRGSDIHIHCEYTLKKYETLQEQEVTVLSDRSHVAPGPCPLRQEQEAQSEGRRGVSQAKAPDFLVWGPQTLLHLSTPYLPPGRRAMYSGWGTVFGHHLSPGEEEAILKMPWPKTATRASLDCYVDGFHLHIAQRQHSEVLTERV